MFHRWSLVVWNRGVNCNRQNYGPVSKKVNVLANQTYRVFRSSQVSGLNQSILPGSGFSGLPPIVYRQRHHVFNLIDLLLCWMVDAWTIGWEHQHIIGAVVRIVPVLSWWPSWRQYYSLCTIAPTVILAPAHKVRYLHYSGAHWTYSRNAMILWQNHWLLGLVRHCWLVQSPPTRKNSIL